MDVRRIYNHYYNLDLSLLYPFHQTSVSMPGSLVWCLKIDSILSCTRSPLCLAQRAVRGIYCSKSALINSVIELPREKALPGWNKSGRSNVRWMDCTYLELHDAAMAPMVDQAFRILVVVV
jgi:hypothetical protein